MKEENFKTKIQQHFSGRMDVSTRELHSYIKELQPRFSGKTISWKIHFLKESGEFNHVGRGVYSFCNKLSFNPSFNPMIKKLYHQIKKKLPYINLCIWETRWLNSFMILQMNRFFIVIETEKDGVESVFHLISENHKNVFIHPDRILLERYNTYSSESIIVQSLISEAPVITKNEISTASIEKILVDCLADKEFFSAQQGELDQIFRSAFEKYNVNINKAKRYARRRGRVKELDKMLLNHYKTTAK